MTEQKTLSKERVKIGITPTSWWNDDFLDIDIGIPFEQCVSEMALAGYEGCSVGHKFPTDVEELKQKLEMRGLQVSEPWTSTFFTCEDMYEKTIDDFKESLAFIKAMGGKDVVVAELGHSVHQRPLPIFSNRPIFTDDQWGRVVNGLHELGKIANAEGMNLCYHHHMGSGIQTRKDVDRLMESTDPELVHLLLDTGHLFFSGDDPLAMTQAYASRIKHVHLKNIRKPIMDEAIAGKYSFKESIEAGIFTVPGDPEGCLDFPPIFQALADVDFEGWMVVEAEQNPANATPLKYAKMGRDYLREVTGV